MNFKRLAAFAVGITVFGCSPLSEPENSISSQYSIHLTGRIMDKDGSPMANAVVKLKGRNLCDTTGADGCYCISEKKGDHTLADPCGDSLEYCKDGQVVTRHDIHNWIDTLSDIYMVQRDIYGGLTSLPQSFGRITATITGPDSTSEVKELWYNVANQSFSGFIYSVYSSDSLNYSVCVSVYNSAGVLTGRSMTIVFPSRTAGDINVPAFDPSNRCPRNDSTIDTVIITPLAAPTLFSPPSGEVNLPTSLWLQWSIVSAAASYHVQVATDSGFSGIYMQDSTNTDSMALISGLAYRTVYYWRVRAKNAGGVSAWSNRWSFTTRDTVTQTPGLPGPVAWWTFDSVAGNTFSDVTGHGFNASWTGTGIGLAQGVKGQALSCPGSGFEITAANSLNNLDFTKFSIETWCYSNTDFSQNSNEVKIFDHQSLQGSGGPTGGYTLHVDPNGQIVFAIGSSDGNSWPAARSATLLKGRTWYHIVCTYDSSVLRIYLNGNLDATYSYAGTYIRSIYDARIGCQRRLDGSVRYLFNGKIDELKVYNYALPADSVLAHYNGR